VSVIEFSAYAKYKVCEAKSLNQMQTFCTKYTARPKYEVFKIHPLGSGTRCEMFG